MLHSGYLITFGIAAFQNIVSARICEGGHRCSPPRECCPQGCCYLYVPPSAPRSTPPSTDHVLNLFFINHWYFWCVVLALILAILCACSLWKKRRQLCGWGSPRPHSQSGDSAGSCYAPPQYSRCSSFHHAPPPYTEVTSKPDMYPLVFTCNGDNTKNGGSSYLMVQYFRNYIVRPVGSLSATSTVDSLSSSFICTANEQNTLVPPPYSRAASPDLPISMTAPAHHHAAAAAAAAAVATVTGHGMPRSASQQGCSLEQYSYRPVPIFSPRSGDDVLSHSMMGASCSRTPTPTSGNSSCNSNNNQMRLSESVNFQTIYLSNNLNSSDNNVNQVILSQSDQSFRHNSHSKGNNNSNDCVPYGSATGGGGGGATAISSAHNTQQNYNKQSNISKYSTNQKQYNSTNAIYNSCGSIEGIAIAIPVSNNGGSGSGSNGNGGGGGGGEQKNYKELDILRRSLETCCQILQQQQQIPCNSFSEDSPVNPDLSRKYTESMRSYVNSNTGSAVSSLANIGSPDSPPRATSPTCEVKELLEQIRQLQQQDGSDSIDGGGGIDDEASEPLTAHHQLPGTSGDTNQPAPLKTKSPALMLRPSTLQQTRKEFFSKSTKSRYFPIASSAVKSIRSPIGSGYAGLLGKGRGRKGWISRSAPTTPGTAMPPCFLDDDSPLLNEQDEDAEHNA